MTIQDSGSKPEDQPVDLPGRSVATWWTGQAGFEHIQDMMGARWNASDDIQGARCIGFVVVAADDPSKRRLEVHAQRHCDAG